MNGDKNLEKILEHIEIYNREMGEVKRDISWIKMSLTDIKKNLSNLPVWATVIISLLTATVGWFIHSLF